MSRRKSKGKDSRRAAMPLSRRKVWCFRLAALAGVPLAFLVVLELLLRLGGFGYPTGFLLKSSNRGKETFVQNNQFGWRFFGPRAARLPAPILISREEQPGVIRIFVFGESAAYGDPQPRFGLPRMLEATLGLRHPNSKFEVINAAMTGINSHVIRPLARDCERARADVWVIYMGNNEVVGPFGAGTVFGNQTTPLPLIRAGLALKATRMGQLFDALSRTADKDAAFNNPWEGMRAFVDYKVARSDPRLGAVYENFRRNLNDILEAGRGSGAKIVLSTMAVNLKDCAPFASLHRPDLSEARLAEWQQLFDAGVEAQAGGVFSQANNLFEQAARIDDTFAELRFRRGQCFLALSNAVAARNEFAAARDLDALRFRCDARLNEIIRERAADRIALADAERLLAEASPDGIPGAELFFEHVHLTFDGNYLLARVLASEVEKVLSLPASSRWPTVQECAQRLGYTERDAQLILSDIRGRIADIPFTFQANHDDQMRRLAEASRQLPPPDTTTTLSESRLAVETALARWPADAVLWERLAEIRQSQGDIAGALDAVQRSIEELPGNAGAWLLRGILLAQSEKFEDAITAFEKVLVLDPQAVWARHNLALCLEKLGRSDDAVKEFKHALALKPEYGTAWLALGQLYEKIGRTNDAAQCFTNALSHRVNHADDLAVLARFCASRGWWESAVTNYTATIELRPADPGLRLEAGRALVMLSRFEDAVREYQTAVELAPGEIQPHMQLGVTLGRLRRPALAETEFREVLRLNPDMIEARVNLGIALHEQQKFDEALAQFEEVLKRNPNDANARRYVQQLRERLSSVPR